MKRFDLKPEHLRAFLARDWSLPRRVQDEETAALALRMDWSELLRRADELRDAARWLAPEWPNAQKDEEDLAAHAKQVERLAAFEVSSVSGPRERAHEERLTRSSGTPSNLEFVTEPLGPRRAPFQDPLWSCREEEIEAVLSLAVHTLLGVLRGGCQLLMEGRLRYRFAVSLLTRQSFWRK